MGNLLPSSVRNFQLFHIAMVGSEVENHDACFVDYQVIECKGLYQHDH